MAFAYYLDLFSIEPAEDRKKLFVTILDIGVDESLVQLVVKRRRRVFELFAIHQGAAPSEISIRWGKDSRPRRVQQREPLVNTCLLHNCLLEGCSYAPMHQQRIRLESCISFS